MEGCLMRGVYGRVSNERGVWEGCLMRGVYGRVSNERGVWKGV